MLCIECSKMAKICTVCSNSLALTVSMLFHTNQISYNVIDFHLLTPAESIGFISNEEIFDVHKDSFCMKSKNKPERKCNIGRV